MHDHTISPRVVRRLNLAVLIVGVGSALSGCINLPRYPAVPATQTTQAVISAAPGSRYWPDLDPSPLFREGLLSVDRELRMRQDDPRTTAGLPTASLLAISGGGDNGAFAAGLLVGWTATGTRPTFKMVTGVSAGALIAPFAFLGSDYDNVLQHVSRVEGGLKMYRLTRRSVPAIIAWEGVGTIWDRALVSHGPPVRDAAFAVTGEAQRSAIVFIFRSA